MKTSVKRLVTHRVHSSSAATWRPPQAMMDRGLLLQWRRRNSVGAMDYTLWVYAREPPSRCAPNPALHLRRELANECDVLAEVGRPFFQMHRARLDTLLDGALAKDLRFGAVPQMQAPQAPATAFHLPFWGRVE